MHNTESCNLLAELLGYLRSLHWLYNTLHWLAAGANGYQLHLLYERLYQGLGGEIDALAEKAVAYCGAGAVDPLHSLERTRFWVEAFWATGDRGPLVALTAEQKFQDVVARVYADLKAAGQLPLGLDDFIMGLAERHETAIYLLGQVSGQAAV